MEKAYIGINFPNLITVALIVAVMYALYNAVRKMTGNKAPMEVM